MLSYKAFLALLPGIKPLVTRRLISEGIILTPSERSDLHDRDASFLDTVVVVGPVAAAALLRAYKDGRLPMTKAGQEPFPAPGAEDYVAQADRWAAEISERDRLKRAAETPALLRPDDLFDFRVLDAVFVRQLGLGRGTLTLTGFSVTKSLVEYCSNSGKSRDWMVSFSWTDAEGNYHNIKKDSVYASNRRNDPARDWGLPE